MLFGVINIFVVAHLTHLFLKPWCIMIERLDTTWPAVVPSEPSEVVKE